MNKQNSSSKYSSGISTYKVHKNSHPVIKGQKILYKAWMEMPNTWNSELRWRGFPAACFVLELSHTFYSVIVVTIIITSLCVIPCQDINLSLLQCCYLLLFCDPVIFSLNFETNVWCSDFNVNTLHLQNSMQICIVFKFQYTTVPYTY